MILILYGGTLVEPAEARGAGTIWGRYGASTYTVPVEIPVVHEDLMSRGGGGEGQRKREEEEENLLEEEAILTTIATWAVRRAR